MCVRGREAVLSLFDPGEKRREPVSPCAPSRDTAKTSARVFACKYKIYKQNI